MSKRRLVKATFEATLNSQEKLRLKLDDLIKEGRCILDEEERSYFMQLLAHSTLGLGARYNVTYAVRDSSDGGFVGLHTNLDHFARWLCYQTSEMVDVPQNLQHYHRTSDIRVGSVPIKNLWEVLLHEYLNVFSEALDRSIGMSKERDERVGSDSFDLDGE